MNDSFNQLGGTSQTNQNLVAPQNYLQTTGSQNQSSEQNLQKSASSSLNNTTSLRLIGPTGQPVSQTLGANTSTQTVASQATSPQQNNLPIILFSGLIIAAILVGTWWMTQQSKKSKY